MHEYLFFTALMFADTLFLAYLSSNYKYKTFQQQINDCENENIVIIEDKQIKDLIVNKTLK